MKALAEIWCAEDKDHALAAVKAFEATRWRAVNAPHLVALVRAGARFERGSSSSAPRSSRHDRCGRTGAYESGQLVVTLPAVILTIAHCGSGPANPGYGPPVYLCDSSSTRMPSGSSWIEAVPCTWALS